MHKDKVSFIEPLHFHHNRHSMLPLKLVISTQIYWFYVSVQVFSIVLVLSMVAILPFTSYILERGPSIHVSVLVFSMVVILPFVSLPNFSRSKKINLVCANFTNQSGEWVSGWVVLVAGGIIGTIRSGTNPQNADITNTTLIAGPAKRTTHQH